jgi:CubicO group peptidase (beta-lactamase class C family)
VNATFASTAAEINGIVHRVSALRPAIEEILSSTGTAGLNYGIIHGGEVVHVENFGLRDFGHKLPMNEDTIVQVCSLTKQMIAAAIGMLVEQGKLSWDTPIKDILPQWKLQDPNVHDLTTISDCLSHRTGLQMNNYWLASNNNIIIPLRDSMKLINGLRPVKPFRGQFQYNNLGYEIAAHVIREVSRSSWDEMLRNRLFEPLGMTRTGTREGFAGPENVARCYNALSNATPIPIGQGQIGDNTVAGAAGGVRSTLNDMLKLAQAWMKAAEHQFR